jgi:hypothetical protein
MLGINDTKRLSFSFIDRKYFNEYTYKIKIDKKCNEDREEHN